MINDRIQLIHLLMNIYYVLYQFYDYYIFCLSASFQLRLRWLNIKDVNFQIQGLSPPLARPLSEHILEKKKKKKKKIIIIII